MAIIVITDTVNWLFMCVKETYWTPSWANDNLSEVITLRNQDQLPRNQVTPSSLLPHPSSPMEEQSKEGAVFGCMGTAQIGRKLPISLGEIKSRWWNHITKKNSASVFHLLGDVASQCSWGHGRIPDFFLHSQSAPLLFQAFVLQGGSWNRRWREIVVR